LLQNTANVVAGQVSKIQVCSLLLSQLTNMPVLPTTSHYALCLGKQFKKQFIEGIHDGRKSNHEQFNFRLSGEGLTAEYLCASEQTKLVLQKWILFDGVECTPARIRAMLRILRATWLAFMDDPELHVERLTAVRGEQSLVFKLMPCNTSSNCACC
jgi:hypothetical protein